MALFVVVSCVFTVDAPKDIAVGICIGTHEPQDEAELCAGLSLLRDLFLRASTQDSWSTKG